MMFLIIILFLLLLVAFLVLIERNILGLGQKRKGPNLVGFYGLMQTIMDGMKLLMKNMIFPHNSLSLYFFYGPILGFLLSLIMWFFLPLPFTLINLYYGLILILFIGSLNSYSIMWSGWGSYSSYSKIGSLRSVAQMISYEVVLSFFFIIFLMNKGIYSFSSVLWYNQMFYIFFFFIFFVWIVISLAENNRTPFDLVEGESELVGGYNVEYSGSLFTLLFLSEYLVIWVFSFITMVFFFYFSLIIIMLMMLLFIFLRVTLPRYKYYDLIKICWLIILPFITFVLIFFL
uniref:NADH-ubiquinone oxidoreductase chain 1 n=1 Tax=Lissoclinum sp. TIC-2013-079 TaxID=2010181 RepID=A0A2D1BXV3_9ASCI|nr:NADH dehydrogenase subunit 1 [Lissoclinum sp. TIC-2013-079]